MSSSPSLESKGTSKSRIVPVIYVVMVIMTIRFVAVLIIR